LISIPLLLIFTFDYTLAGLGFPGYQYVLYIKNLKQFVCQKE